MFNRTGRFLSTTPRPLQLAHDISNTAIKVWFQSNSGEMYYAESLRRRRKITSITYHPNLTILRVESKVDLHRNPAHLHCRLPGKLKDNRLLADFALEMVGNRLNQLLGERSAERKVANLLSSKETLPGGAEEGNASREAAHQWGR